jgi:hypothetical protein
MTDSRFFFSHHQYINGNHPYTRQNDDSVVKDGVATDREEEVLMGSSSAAATTKTSSSSTNSKTTTTGGGTTTSSGTAAGGDCDETQSTATTTTATAPSIRGEVLDLAADLRTFRPGDRLDIPYELTVSESIQEFWQSAFHSQDRINTSR